MSSTLEFPRTLSPRRRPSSSSASGLSPSRNPSISRPNSSASSATNINKKRSRVEEQRLNDLPEDTTIIHSPQPAIPPSAQYSEGTATLSRLGGGETNGTVEEAHDEREDSVSTDDLLVQLPEYDWLGFMKKFEKTLKDIGVEKELLSKEYDMWNWMYEIWSSSRDRDDTLRLSREMATIIQWTKLREADLERAREAHTQSMLAISSVLGIVPKNVTPPPSTGKNKKR